MDAIKNLIIGLETKEDYRAVENLTRVSFWNVYRPGCMEHYVLHCYRNDPAFVPELDFVMELGGELIGQRNRGVAPPDHRPAGGRVARSEVEAVCGNEPRRNVASEPEASVKFPEPLLAGRRDEERRIVAALRDEPPRFAHQLRSQSASPVRRVRRYAINIGRAS